MNELLAESVLTEFDSMTSTNTKNICQHVFKKYKDDLEELNAEEDSLNAADDEEGICSYKKIQFRRIKYSIAFWYKCVYLEFKKIQSAHSYR